MKILLTLAACFFTAVLLFLSCKKDKQPPVPPVAVNLPPVARAGADTTITLSSCGEKIMVPLNGTKSSDPEGKITSSSWRLISGPRDYYVTKSNSLYTTAVLRRAGVYSFELLIGDIGYLTSKDTVSITVIGSTPKEYDLDISSNTTYIFRDNFKDDYYMNYYYDYTEILGTGNFVPLGALNISLYEQTDTAALSYGTTYLSVYNTDYTTYVNGSTFINLKKLIQQGGGAFTGNFNITNGSAKFCDDNIYNSLAPLMVTGSLDTASKKVSIRIKGKVFF